MPRIVPLDRRAVAVLALAAALLGCFYPQSRKEEAEAKAKAAYAKCGNDLSAGVLKTHLDAVNCAGPDVIAAYSEAAYPFEDLVLVSIEARRVGAANVDRGAVSAEEYRRDVAVLDQRLAAEDARRQDLIKYGRTPVPESAESLVQGLPAFAPPPRTAASPPPPAGARPGCTALGDIRPCR